MKKNRFAISLFLVMMLLLTALVLGGCEDPEPAEPPPDDPEEAVFERNIKVGIVDTYTGPPTVYTYDALDAFELALKEINEEGIHGVEMEFVTRDEEFAPDQALSWARELVTREEVDVLCGFMSSASALAVSEYVREEQVPMITWAAQSEQITGEAGHSYVFSVVPNTRISGRAAANFLAELPYTRYALVGSDFEFGHAIITRFWDTFQELRPDAEVVLETYWPVGEADFTPYISSIRGADPEVVVAAPGGADQIPLTKAIGDAELTDEMEVYLHIGTDHAALSALGDEAPEGMYGSSSYHYYYPETEENLAFAEMFYEEYERYPNFVGYNGYITAHLIAEAFREAGSLDGEAFAEALSGLTIDSPVGPITMREYDNQLIHPFFIGKTAEHPDKPYLISTDITMLDGEKIMPPVEEIMEVRGE